MRASVKSGHRHRHLGAVGKYQSYNELFSWQVVSLSTQNRVYPRTSVQMQLASFVFCLWTMKVRRQQGTGASELLCGRYRRGAGHMVISLDEIEYELVSVPNGIEFPSPYLTTIRTLPHTMI